MARSRGDAGGARARVRARAARPGAAVDRARRPAEAVALQFLLHARVDRRDDGPFFLETLANGTLLPFERAATVAHEWSHLAGYADESEANFVGWLVCMRGPASAQYSGWLSLVWHDRRRAARDPIATT